MSSSQRLIVFLFDTVSFLAKNLAYFLIAENLIEGCMLIESTDYIFILSLFNYSSSVVSFWSNAWTMETH